MQAVAMKQGRLSRPGGQFATGVVFENPAPGRLIGFGDIDIGPAFGWEGMKPLCERFLHRAVAAFPDHQRGRIGRTVIQRQTEDKGMGLADHPALFRTDGQKSVKMGGIPVPAKGEGGGGFVRAGLRVARAQGGKLGGVKRHGIKRQG